MDDKHLANKKKAAAQRLIRTEAYAEKVRTLFAKTVNEILALNKTMPTLEDGVMYSFDGDSIKKQKEVEALLRRLSSTVTMAVQNGIKLEWDAANKECDQFVKSVFGKKVLSTPEFTAYMDRNTAARDAFIGRTENGLDLSKRVWKSVKQLREEMEVAMTVAIGEGDSASSMSRKVREYLNDPDLMFRRFRYKKGEKDIIDPTTGEIVGSEPIYGKKWKKRVKDEKTGKYKWIDYDRDTYKTGNGVYKSSARNAMRVTRTETNIAYRRADNARWQNMDFVLGQHIELSKSHPKKDICDDLVGDYPKDFVFDGWHPQCYSDDSEVLTADGWKLFKDICDDDMILSLNPDTRNVEYVGIIDRQHYEKHGAMQHFFNRSLDCLVTDEHQMVYLNKSDGAIKHCRADEYRQSKGAFYRGCEYQSVFVNKAKTIGGHTIAFEDYCEFMGYWLADGSLERQYGIHIAQKKGLPLRNDIIACIERMGFVPKEREYGIVFYSIEINAFLAAFGHAHDKFIPTDILNATQAQIGVFLNAFIACDGYVRDGKAFIGNHGCKFEPKGQERLYYTTSPKMAGQLGELILKIGKRPSYAIQKASTTVKKDGKVIKGNYDCWKIAECNAVTATVFNKEAVQYDGYVYDLSLERNHIMYIRRNGKCFWGSNCFCFCTPILMDEAEMAKVTEAFLNGETYEPKGKQITEYPTAFKDWVREHSTDIAKARERGTEPYFIRNNQMAIDEIINPSAKKKTALEIAEERHAARTSEQEDAIRLRAANRQKAISAGKRYLDEFEGVDNVDTSALREAYEHGRWEDVRSEALKLAQKKRSVLEYSIEKMNEAKDYGEIDITALQSALKSGKFAQMQNEAMAMQKLINQTKAAENAISDLIPEAHEWHKQFSMAELQQTHAAVQKKLNDISGLPLAEQKKKLEMEIKYVEDPTYLKPHTQYPTWKVSQDAYIKKLNEVVVKIEIEAVEQQLAVVKAWSVNHPKSLNVANLLAEAQSAIANSEDITIIKQKANLAIAEHQKRLAEQARRDAKNVGKVSKDVTLLQTDKDAYSQKRKDAAIWCKSSRESDDLWGDESDDLWNSLTPEQQKAWYDYTAGSGHMNRPLRGYSGGWGWGHYKGVGNVPLDNEGGEANIRNLKGVLDTTISTQDKWLQRGIETWSGVEGFIGVRNLTREQLRGMVGRIVTDYSFMSCGSAKGTGFSGTILNIYCPKGSKTFYAKRHSAYKSENETFMQIGATYRIIKVEAPDYGNVYIDIELIGYKEHPLL